MAADRSVDTHPFTSYENIDNNNSYSAVCIGRVCSSGVHLYTQRERESKENIVIM